MTALGQLSLADLVSQLPEVYQPIYRHPELSRNVSRACEDRFAVVRDAYLAVAKLHARPLRVLDLGCAQGFFSLSLAALGARVRGVDVVGPNIAVCQALASEQPSLDVEFVESSIESELEALEPGRYDFVLGLSVFHHLIRAHGEHAVRDWIAALAKHTAAGVFEVALKLEPMPWAPSQPVDERGLFESFAFVHQLGRFPTHLSDIARPLFFASNRFWFLDGDAAEFRRWSDASHALEGGIHVGTRRYFESDSAVAKLFLLKTYLADKNLEELEREARLLEAPPVGLPRLPKLIRYGRTAMEAWLVRERLPGKLLLEMMAEGVRYDARRIIRDVLSELCALESAGLFHDDVRVWNVLVAPDGSASLLDFGSISAERRDCAWPDDPLLSFWIFVHDVATAKVERIIPHRQPFMSPLNLPSDLRDWALTVWDRPVHDWSYRLFLECLDQTNNARATAYASATRLWMAAIEQHVDGMVARIEAVEARAEENEEHLARVGATLSELANADAAQSGQFAANALALRADLEILKARAESLDAQREDATQRASALNPEMAAHHELLVQRVEAVRAELAQSSARELLEALAECRSRVASLAGELSAANAAYLSIEQSRSWRITKPLRLAKRSLRHAWNWLASQLRAIVHIP